MKDPMLEAIELLCSAWMIASRGGKDTNWPAFQARLTECLAEFNRNGMTPRTFRIPPSDDVTAN